MFEIHISTKNRRVDLLFTLTQLQTILDRTDLGCVVFDDGSTDGTYEAVSNQFPKVRLLRNEKSKGYLYCRNQMLNQTQADYAISLDDDAHFLSANPLEEIQSYFMQNPDCGLIAFRLFWSLESPKSIQTSEKPHQAQSYVGCGHAWRMKAWRDIPNYPEWFEFYGEENIASLHLFKKGWRVDYLPQVLVQHRVDLKKRTQSNNDFAFRYRRSIRSGWYSFLLFFPKAIALELLAYSIYTQFKTKIFKGDFKVILPLFLAITDLFLALPKIFKYQNRLTADEYKKYTQLKVDNIYWEPEK
ncbi:MAG: glycosyltransferase [Flavobacteriaceae bacterium]